MKIIFPTLALFCLLILACERNTSNPTMDCPPEIITLSVDTLTIDHQKIVLRTSLWRDFMPIAPPNGRPLIAYVEIETVDSSAITLDMDSDRIYIVKGKEVWASSFAEEPPPDDVLMHPFRIVKIARDGPKWGPDILVHVVVRITANGEVYFLRADNQYIYSTW